SFMGSEFAYEDIASQEVEKYDYKYLRQEPCGKNECFVTEEYPLHPKSGYKRMIVWTDKTEYMIRKVDYYDRKNTHLKTLTFKGYEKYVNKFWRADEMEMTNHRTGKSTKILWKEYKFNTGLTDKDFRRNALKRAK
ncbi:MAG: outer membrane lipoprotein-sorting protein, partial [Deltaproteobacteria bacterium]|nr:outer membrane lipoprotein-sorting protein [Deltaproteobacteria bacterium]